MIICGLLLWCPGMIEFEEFEGIFEGLANALREGTNGLDASQYDLSQRQLLKIAYSKFDCERHADRLLPLPSTVRETLAACCHCLSV